MLCLADRQFFGHALWGEAAATGESATKRGVLVARGVEAG
jgi:hypothetical protein